MPEPPDRSTFTRAESITPEAFARLRNIFEAALERPISERRAFAAAACLNNHDLLRELEAMLAADENNDLLLKEALFPGVPNQGRFVAGEVLEGRYRIVGLIGKGGMGEVYRADDLILNQPVALKFVSAATVSDAALARFRNEVRIARRVSHPNVCRVYDIGVADGLYFLSMEYIDGEDLASLIRRIGRLPQDKAIEFSRKICAALGAAHDLECVASRSEAGQHNDRRTWSGPYHRLRVGWTCRGDSFYRSSQRHAGVHVPRAEGWQGVTARSDMYSLGLVVYKMFTGRRGARQVQPVGPGPRRRSCDRSPDSAVP